VCALTPSLAMGGSLTRPEAFIPPAYLPQPHYAPRALATHCAGNDFAPYQIPLDGVTPALLSLATLSHYPSLRFPAPSLLALLSVLHAIKSKWKPNPAVLRALPLHLVRYCRSGSHVQTLLAEKLLREALTAKQPEGGFLMEGGEGRMTMRDGEMYETREEWEEWGEGEREAGEAGEQMALLEDRRGDSAVVVMSSAELGALIDAMPVFLSLPDSPSKVPPPPRRLPWEVRPL
jgi:hypothetical protein